MAVRKIFIAEISRTMMYAAASTHTHTHAHRALRLCDARVRTCRHAYESVQLRAAQMETYLREIAATARAVAESRHPPGPLLPLAGQ